MSTLLYLEMGGAPPRARGALANASIVSDYRLEDTGGCRGHTGFTDMFTDLRGCVVRATNLIRDLLEMNFPSGLFGEKKRAAVMIFGSRSTQAIRCPHHYQRARLHRFKLTTAFQKALDDQEAAVTLH